MKNKCRSLTALTLLELSIVIVVVSVLASIAYPRFTRTIEVTIGREARVSLELIFAAEKIIEMQTALMVTCNNTADCNNVLNLDLSGDNWNYVVVWNAGLGQFVFAAIRTAGTYSNTTLVMDDTGALCPGTLVCTWPFANLL